MFGLPPSVQIYFYNKETDMRKSINGLSAIVQYELSLNPLSGHLFVFLGKRKNAVKILFWDRDGFCLFQKKLELGVFHKPVLQVLDNTLVAMIEPKEMTLLLQGVELDKLKKLKRKYIN
jgi:transposase